MCSVCNGLASVTVTYKRYTGKQIVAHAISGLNVHRRARVLFFLWIQLKCYAETLKEDLSQWRGKSEEDDGGGVHIVHANVCVHNDVVK